MIPLFAETRTFARWTEKSSLFHFGKGVVYMDGSQKHFEGLNEKEFESNWPKVRELCKKYEWQLPYLQDYRQNSCTEQDWSGDYRSPLQFRDSTSLINVS